MFAVRQVLVTLILLLSFSVQASTEMPWVNEISFAPRMDFAQGAPAGGQIGFYIPLEPRWRLHVEGESYAYRESDTVAALRLGPSFNFSYDALRSVYLTAGAGYDGLAPGYAAQLGLFGYTRLGTHALIWGRRWTYSPYIEYANDGRLAKGRIEFLNLAYVY